MLSTSLSILQHSYALVSIFSSESLSLFPLGILVSLFFSLSLKYFVT